MPGSETESTHPPGTLLGIISSCSGVSLPGDAKKKAQHANIELSTVLCDAGSKADERRQGSGRKHAARWAPRTNSSPTPQPPLHHSTTTRPPPLQGNSPAVFSGFGHTDKAHKEQALLPRAHRTAPQRRAGQVLTRLILSHPFIHKHPFVYPRFSFASSKNLIFFFHPSFLPSFLPSFSSPRACTILFLLRPSLDWQPLWTRTWRSIISPLVLSVLPFNSKILPIRSQDAASLHFSID